MDRRHFDIHRRCRLHAEGAKGQGPVLYWMSRDQRCADNWALLRACEDAVIDKRSLLVVFCLVWDYPGANLRHFGFLLRGLVEVQAHLRSCNIGFLLLEGNPVDKLTKLISSIDAHSLITDFDPLIIKQSWKKQLLEKISVPFWEVDSHNIIPAWIVSDKKEYAAYTIRPKIHRLLGDYLTDFPPLEHFSDLPQIPCPALNLRSLLRKVHDTSVSEVSWCISGEIQALSAMRKAVTKRLFGYAEGCNDPCRNIQSNLSPYLHFGQLSPQRLALEVMAASLPQQDKDAFLEELIVRRELADNFCYHEPDYDTTAGFPDWAMKTLQDHHNDPRDYLYTQEEWEQAETHDSLWNACQKDLSLNGKLHGYLRMYWAKKILEWSADPEEAIKTAIYLNDRYSLDGRDPNGYTGIAWSIGGVHDRAWKERAVFGKIRYMNLNGCRRKFDVNGYISQINALSEV